MGLFSKTVQYIKDRLDKTRSKIRSSLSSILTLGRKIDEQLLTELEETLIRDDIGVETTQGLIEDLRAGWKSWQISASEDVIPFLKDKISGYWPPQDRKLNIAAAGPTAILVAGINATARARPLASPSWTARPAAAS
jgi:fused signal recognition particle receptor